MTKEKTQKNKDSKAPLIILTAGGTGGHVYPAEALADELSARGYRLSLVTDKRGNNNYKGKLGEIKNYAVCAGPLVGKSKFTKIKSLFKTLIGSLQACYIILKNKPICVVGFGGYASFPCCVAAIALRKKLIIHEQNSVMSRTNRILSKSVSLIAQSFENVKFTPENVKTILTGMPVRKSIIDIKDRKYPIDGKMQLLILGGSQGAKTLSDIVPEAIKKFPKETQSNFVIYQQCRAIDEKNLKKAYKDIHAEVTISSFFNNMPEIYSKTNIIISRSGASSVSEILAIGIPSILVPLATAADNHQTFNCSGVERAKAGFVINQKDFTVENLFKTLKGMIEDTNELYKMAERAKKAGITDAAKRLADAIEITISQK